MIVTRHSGLDAGQKIGGTADLLRPAPRMVRDMDVSYASSHKDVKLRVVRTLKSSTCAIGELPSMAWISASLPKRRDFNICV